jgi:hypothetical protein
MKVDDRVVSEVSAAVVNRRVDTSEVCWLSISGDERLDVADTLVLTGAQLHTAWPPLAPPAHGRGWPQAATPPANVREWEAAQPVIQPDQCKAETIFPLNSSQRRYIDRQLRSNSRHAD